jgi:hypothetical protein
LAIVILALTADCFSSSVANDTELKIELRHNANFGASLALWLAIKVVMGVRVSEQEEAEGVDVAECGLHAYPEFTIKYKPHNPTIPCTEIAPTGSSILNTLSSVEIENTTKIPPTLRLSNRTSQKYFALGIIKNI